MSEFSFRKRGAVLTHGGETSVPQVLNVHTLVPPQVALAITWLTVEPHSLG